MPLSVQTTKRPVHLGLWATDSLDPSPEQLRQTNTPRLTEAQVGPREPQSAQRRFSSCFRSADRMALCRSFCCAVTLSLSFRTMAAPGRLSCKQRRDVGRLGGSAGGPALELAARDGCVQTFPFLAFTLWQGPCLR